MPLVVFGISHKTAPIELREKISFSPDRQRAVLDELRREGFLNEAAVLSTCNRTEIYGAAEGSAAEEGARFLSRAVGGEDLGRYVYAKSDGDMIAHLFSVAAGLDSLVLGENEILKQVKDAYALAQGGGYTGKILNVLFQRALYVGKLVRTHTAIGHGALSVGSVAVALSEKIFGDLSQSSVLIFGAGKMAEVSARYLLSKKVSRLWVANRTLENARALAEKFKAEPLSLTEGLERLVSADIVITSMAAPEPILERDFIAKLMPRRQNKSLFIVDIAVPRNVDPGAHRVDNVYLYNIDDLEAIVDENVRGRSAEIRKAAEIVEHKSAEFFEWVRSVQAGAEKSLRHNSDFLKESAG